jgi:hypothetical protein
VLSGLQIQYASDPSCTLLPYPRIVAMALPVEISQIFILLLSLLPKAKVFPSGLQPIRVHIPEFKSIKRIELLFPLKVLSNWFVMISRISIVPSGFLDAMNR